MSSNIFVGSILGILGISYFNGRKILTLPIRCKKISAKGSTALVPWGANCFSPRLLNITRGDLWPLTPTPLPDGEREG